MKRHVMSDHLALSQEPVVLDPCIHTKVVADHRQNLLPTLSTLGARSVIHEIVGDQLVNQSLIWVVGREQSLNNLFRIRIHPLTLT